MFFRKQKIKSNIQSLLHHWKPILLGLILIFAIIPIGYYFKTKNNQEQPLNYDISRAYFSDYEYQNKNQDFQISFLDKKDLLKPWVNFAVAGNNIGMTLNMDNAKTPNNAQTPQRGVSTIDADNRNNKLTIPDILPDTDLTYQIIDKGLKEDIVLKNKEALGNNKKPQYQFTLKSDNVEPIEISKGIYSPAFQNKVTKEYAFHFMRPVMIDANGAKSDEIIMQIKKQEDGKYTIILKPSPEWLNDKERVFPIKIDPSIVHDESSEFAGTKNRIEDIGSGSTPKLQIQNSIGGNDQYTKLLLHADGTDNSTAFSDSQMSYANRKTVTASGNAKISTTQSEFGGSSAYFDGTGDYLSVPDSEDWNFGSGDFTIDFWAKPIVYHLNDGIANNFIYEQGTANADQFAILFSNGKFRASGYSGSSYCEVLGSSDVLSGGIWKHYAVVGTGGRVYLYVNGVFDTSGVCGIVPNFATSAYISARWNQDIATQWNGYLDEFRISKGIARWTSNFTPPTRAYDFKKNYAVYDSPVVDAGQTAQWNTISWTENGVATGDGETPYDSTNLVAQWNFNETSGTSATSGGTCGTSCNGTLTNFASTASQDQTAGTGWTANNRRWGAGALQFDGVDDYVSVADNASLRPATISVEAWVYPTVNDNNARRIIEKKSTLNQDDSPYEMYILNGKFVFVVTTSSYTSLTGTAAIEMYKWYHVVGTYDGASLKLYVNGNLAAQIAKTGNITDANNGTVVIGAAINSASSLWGYFPGIIDSIRIYSRALSANEIASNYNAGNIELQTRSGATSDPNDGSWEAWKPSGSGTETAVDAMDANNTSGDAYTKLLLHGEGNNNATGFRDDSLFRKTLTANGDAKISTTQNKYGSSSMYFDGTGDYLSIPDSDDWNFGTNNFTIDFWVRWNSVPGTGYQFLYNQYGSASDRIGISVDNNRLLFGYYNGVTDFMLSGNWTPSNNTWYHIAIIRKSFSNLATDWLMTVDGNSLSLTKTGNWNDAIGNVSGNSYLGSYGSSAAFLNGYIDEFRISKGIARWTANFTPPTAPYDNPNQLTSSNSTAIKTEGTSSMKIDQGKSQCDGNTVALWHLNETGGSGAYLKDSCGTNHGTPTGTSVTDGINNKARSFNGTSDYVSVPDSDNFNFGAGDFSIDFWINLQNKTGENFPIFNTNLGGGYSATLIRFLYTGTEYKTLFAGSSNGVDWQFNSGYISTGVGVNTWAHFSYIRSGNNFYIFRNGTSIYVGSNSTIFANSTDPLLIGKQTEWHGEVYYSKCYLDELRITKGVARTPEEISEAYRLGRDQRISRTISNTDFSAKSKLPFYVAADRRGTYLDATIGESAFANYETDPYDVLFLHGDENINSTSIKDSSNSAKVVTANGDAKIKGPGKMGNAMYFDGTGDYLSVPNSTDFNFGAGDFTLDGWVYFADVETDPFQGIVRQVTSSGTDGFAFEINNGALAFLCNATREISHAFSPRNNKWYHVAVASDSGTIKLFINGSLVKTETACVINISSQPLLVGKGATYSGGIWYPAFLDSYDFNGYLDELRISKGIARTASEIRQAYEVGKRTHSITIDFSASLDTGNLITNSSDLSFIVNSQTYGAPNKGDNLYAGDKIIVRENYDGTEYLAQGTVTNVNQSTGAVTVSSWDSGGTFPASGFTANTVVFKWQKEYWDLTGMFATDKDAINRVSTRITDGTEGRTIYLDDFKTSSSYLTNPATTNNITSTNNRYFQYRAVTSTTDYMFTPYLSQVNLVYTSIPIVTTQTPSAITKNTADANGNITDTGGTGLTVSRRGFEYGLTQTNTWEVHEDGSFSAGSYALPITTGLVHNTGYFVRSYAVNSFGISYGGWVAFNTNMDVSPVELKRNVELRRNIELK